MAITILRPGQHIAQLGNDSMQITAPRGGAGGGWWNDDGAIAGCIGAWLAKGAASYAASRTDLSGTGNNLTEGNGAVSWASGTGWGFAAASAQYLDTGIIPDISAQGYSMLLRYASYVTNAYFMAIYAGASQRFGVGFLSNNFYYTNGGIVSVVRAGISAAVLGVAGNQGYYNGSSDGGAISAAVGVITTTLPIGARRREDLGSLDQHVTANIYAASVYSAVLTGPQMSTVSTAMAAL